MIRREAPVCSRFRGTCLFPQATDAQMRTAEKPIPGQYQVWRDTPSTNPATAPRARSQATAAGHRNR
jgi:hypothetical protein